MSDQPADRITTPQPRRRTLLVAAAGMLALVPIPVGMVLTAGGAARRASVSTPFTPARQTAGLTPERSRSTPRHGPGAVVALVLRPTTIRSAPGGAALARVPTKTTFGSPQTMWVVQRVPGWLGVISTLAGNNRVGWIPLSSGTVGVDPWELKVSLSKRMLTVVDGGRVLRSYPVAIGRPAASTPTGRFAVTDRLLTHDPQGPYGCCVLALSAHSPHAIQGWSGGNRIAIHSTPTTDSIGHAVSHGCVRVTLADGRWLMNHIPLGTPTVIST